MTEATAAPELQTADIAVINGANDIVVINGLDGEGAEEGVRAEGGDVVLAA